MNTSIFASTTTYYKLAAKMETLAGEILQATNDPILTDVGFSLLKDSREMVRDHLDFLKSEEDKSTKVATVPDRNSLEAAFNTAVDLFIKARNPGAGDDFIPSIEDTEAAIEYRNRLEEETLKTLANKSR
ncbi:MAG: hypothetical protein AB7T74_13865 [Clostridia bacterium]